MQERVLAGGAARFAEASKGRVHVGQLGVVLGVLGDPLARQHLDGLHGLLLQVFGINRAEKAAHIGLGGTEHGGIVPQAARPSGGLGYSGAQYSGDTP